MFKLKGSRGQATRTVAIIIATAATGSMLAACGSSSSDGSASGASGSAAGKKVTLVGYSKANPWAVAANTKMIADLEAKDVKVTSLLSADPATQVQQLNQAISQKPDAIITQLIDTKSAVTAIRKADQAGVDVVVYDGPPEPSVADLTHQVLSDNVALGEFAAQNIVDGLKAVGKTKGNIVAITGLTSMIITQDRMKGFKSVLAKNPGYTLIEEEDGGWDPIKSGQIASQLFAKHGKGGIDGAYGMADYMAIPIVEAAKQAGIPVGASKKGLIVSGGNCFKVGIDSIKEGVLYGTATEDPGTMGTETASYVVDLLSGKNPPKVVTVKEDRVTAENVDDFAERCSQA